MLYKNEDKTVKQVGFLNVYCKTNVPRCKCRRRIIGITADPDFEKNHYVYIFYSPADTSVIVYQDLHLKMIHLICNLKKLILELYSQREICCHTGGSIAFGQTILLYLSTGDNSTPFDEPKQTYVNNGFAPLNDRPGHEQYDARRSSGNTNDLRGKIIRIKIKDDGTYEIPEGNLFPKGTLKQDLKYM